MKQLADMMDMVFPHGIPECKHNGNVFPWYFTVQARAVHKYTGPDYISLFATIELCMGQLKMRIPKYPMVQ